jgi:hypothetical protein
VLVTTDNDRCLPYDSTFNYCVIVWVIGNNPENAGNDDNFLAIPDFAYCL